MAVQSPLWVTEGAASMDVRETHGVSDEWLLSRVKVGDRDALGLLYDRHSVAAYSLAVRLVGAPSAADVVQDAFVALVDRSATFDPARGGFRGWFMTSVHHRCLNLLRAKRPAADEEALEAVPDPGPETADAALQRLRDASVREALLQLPEAQREVLVLAYYLGLSQSALAGRLGVPLGTVKARMRRGLIALRGLLRGEAAGAEQEAEAQ